MGNSDDNLIKNKRKYESKVMKGQIRYIIIF